MIVKRSITIRGHSTSISIEEEFWTILRAVAERRGLAIAALVARIDQARPPGTNLSSAIRLFALEDVLDRLRALTDHAAIADDVPAGPGQTAD